MRDLLLVMRLEWKRFKGEASYWLRLLGIEADTGRLYAMYILFFWSVWLFAIWAYVGQQVLDASKQTPRATLTTLGEIAPALILLLQVGYVIYTLRDTPLKFSAPDLLYVAASPIARGAIALVTFLRTLLLPALLVGLVCALFAMYLIWPVAKARFGVAGFEAFLLGILLVYFTGALAWILALFKLHPDVYPRRRVFWAVVPLIVLAALLLPQIMLAPGYLWLTAAAAEVSVVGALTLIACLLLALIGLYQVGQNAHMTLVMDASQTYARIQRMGIVGKFYARDVIRRIHRQARLARKRRLRFALAPNLSGYNMMIGRSLLDILRLAPGSITLPFLRGMALIGLMVFLIRLTGWQAIQTWLIVLILVIQGRPSFLIENFQQDVGQPFLRQFLPPNNLYRLMASALIPFVLACSGGLLALLAQPGIDLLAGSLLIVLGLAGATLCLALEQVEERQIFFQAIRYPYSVGFCTVLVIIAGFIAHSLYGAILALLLINALLSQMMYYSEDPA